MPTAKKSIKLRDQKPVKDPVGGRKGGPKNKQLNSVDEQRGRGRGRNRF